MITETIQGNVATEPVTATERADRSERLQRPPTLRGRNASARSVEEAWRMARRAVGYASEQVPFESAAASLLCDAGGDQTVLDLADDYLSFTRVAANPRDQFTALSMLERARQCIPKRAHRQAWPAFPRRLAPGRRPDRTSDPTEPSRDRR